MLFLTLVFGGSDTILQGSETSLPATIFSSQLIHRALYKPRKGIMEKKRSTFDTRGHGTAGPRAIKPRGTTPRWRDGSPGCGTPGSAGAAGGVAAALVQPVFHHSRAFPAHLVLLVPSAFSAGWLRSYETLGSGFCAPEKSDRPLAGCCWPPPASPWVVGEAGTVLPAQGGLRAWMSVTQQW